MSDILGTIPAANLRVFVVWEPILKNDTKDAAANDALVFDDARMGHFWDGPASEANLWSEKLGLPKGQLAWDIFILLPAGVTWEGKTPPSPAYWSHNLDVNVGIKYDLEALRQAVRDALAKDAPTERHGEQPASATTR